MVAIKEKKKNSLFLDFFLCFFVYVDTYIYIHTKREKEKKKTKKVRRRMREREKEEFPFLDFFFLVFLEKKRKDGVALFI